MTEAHVGPTRPGGRLPSTKETCDDLDPDPAGTIAETVEELSDRIKTLTEQIQISLGITPPQTARCRRGWNMTGSCHTSDSHRPFDP